MYHNTNSHQQSSRYNQHNTDNYYDPNKDSGSEIYVVDNHYHRNSPNHPQTHRPLSSSSFNRGGYGQGGHGGGHSQGGYARAPSALSSVKPESTISEKKRRHGGVVVETMSAPNPFCPHAKGVCCLLLLINLGLILVTLGFSIVLQLFEPAFVWYCGVLFLITGFVALIASLIFCVSICRDDNTRDNDGQLYWTHHWQKRIDV